MDKILDIMTALKILSSLKLEDTKRKYPTVPEYAIPLPKYSDKTANGLTKCIIDFLILSGQFAERTGNEGRVIDSRKTYTDVLGHTKVSGQVKRIPGSGTKGTSDIKAVINGRMIAIEVKIGADRQSESQKDYQAKVERAGGQYWIVRSFDDFFAHYAKINGPM
jgi:hypothetical protein